MHIAVITEASAHIRSHFSTSESPPIDIVKEHLWSAISSTISDLEQRCTGRVSIYRIYNDMGVSSHQILDQDPRQKAASLE